MTFILVPFVRSIFKYFRFFYGYSGKRIFLYIIMSICGAMMEGIGIALIIPVLNYSESAKPEGALSNIIYGVINVLGLERSLTGILVLIVVVFIIKGFFLIGQGSILVKIQTDLKKEIRLDMIQRYASMDYNYYVNSNIGYLNNIITVEIERVIKSFLAFSGVLTSIFYVGVYVSGAVILDYMLTCFMLFLSVLLVYAMKIVHRLSREFSMVISEKNANIQSLLIQILYSFKYLKATANFGKLIDKLKTEISKAAKLEYRIGFLGVLTKTVIEPLAIFVVCGIVIYHVVVLNGSLAEIGVLILFLYRTFNKMLGFQSGWQRFNALVGGVETLKKAKEGLDANVERNGKMSIDGIDKTISLRNVNFAYENKQVLFDINMGIKKNYSVGIVGESGAGKTTLFDIITGLLVPQDGDVMLGKINYSELDKANLRSIIGYVTQEPTIFNDTIANNISFWQCEANQNECIRKVKAAARLAHSEDFILASENGYETIIGDKGIKLSGGQRQRIAIAREIFKEPEILIFDEATSSLDSESEQYIQRSIDGMMGKCTIIIIAHRVSTIRNCDYMYVLSKGRIVEEGRFDELYSLSNGVFRRMCLLQQI